MTEKQVWPLECKMMQGTCENRLRQAMYEWQQVVFENDFENLAYLRRLEKATAFALLHLVRAHPGSDLNKVVQDWLREEETDVRER